MGLGGTYTLREILKSSYKGMGGGGEGGQTTKGWDHFLLGEIGGVDPLRHQVKIFTWQFKEG